MSAIAITVNGVTTTVTVGSVGTPAPTMIGSNGLTAGLGGSVPTPAADAQGRFLRGDGSWAAGAVSSLTYNGSGQLTGYTEDGIVFALTYNGDGTPNTITGGGSVGTCSYTSGVFTGISYT